ncbi:MauE/DoxX family redox-associated membrane protein [uncultured Mucilaginibacter sp.]|uniref:MauE/DoxX family redox-associated membrane protein n=1 Tax=uncultured Mucilaginibacter sp. TaxID=797541 RepID=UPI0025D52EDA|nr:MauE/DoxX family redox-associated membrane protein [uncultured Mucilaginibacter sp.]
MMKKAFLSDAIATLIIMMFLYAGFSKYFDFGQFKRAMYSQPFPQWFSTVLIGILPPVEIVIAVLLFKDSTRLIGLKATLLTMSLFTLYIAAILVHVFPKVPCSCGGIIRMLTWPRHLVFNIFFLAITIIGLNIRPDRQPETTKRI